MGSGGVGGHTMAQPGKFKLPKNVNIKSIRPSQIALKSQVEKLGQKHDFAEKAAWTLWGLVRLSCARMFASGYTLLLRRHQGQTIEHGIVCAICISNKCCLACALLETLHDAMCWMIPWRISMRKVRGKGLVRRELPLGSQSCAVAHTKAHAALHDSLFRPLSRSPALPLSSLPQRQWSFPLSTAHSRCRPLPGIHIGHKISKSCSN